MYFNKTVIILCDTCTVAKFSVTLQILIINKMGYCTWFVINEDVRHVVSDVDICFIHFYYYSNSIIKTAVLLDFTISGIIIVKCTIHKHRSEYQFFRIVHKHSHNFVSRIPYPIDIP